MICLWRTWPFQSQHPRVSVKIISSLIIWHWHPGKDYLRKRKQMCAYVHINTHTLRKWIRMSGHIWQNQKSTFHINFPWKQIWEDSEAQHYYKISSVSFGEHYMWFKTISEILMVKISCWETWSQRVKSPMCALVHTTVNSGYLKNCLWFTSTYSNNSRDIQCPYCTHNNSIYLVFF